jgi:hypothetical protein
MQNPGEIHAKHSFDESRLPPYRNFLANVLHAAIGSFQMSHR